MSWANLYSLCGCAALLGLAWLTSSRRRLVPWKGIGLGMLAIDVKDGNFQHLEDAGRVGARPALLRQGRKADLVIDDHVQCSTDGIRGQLAQIERLLNDPFPGKRGVSVNQ